MEPSSLANVEFSFLPILTGSDLSTRRLPVMKMQGKKDGPVIWLTACIHGDEVGGMVVIQEVFKRLGVDGLKQGTLCALPLMNPIGFENMSRSMPLNTSINTSFSEQDINRSFPGRPDGTLAERIAEKILHSIVETRPAFVIDLHNDWLNSIPYVLTDPYPGLKLKEVHQTITRYAHTAGFAVINEEQSPDDRDDIKRTLTGSLMLNGVPALTIELGPSYIVNEKFVEYGVRAVMNMLAAFDMCDAEPFVFDLSKQFTGKVLRYTHEPRASASGIVRFLAHPGDVVRKDQPIAHIYNAFGQLQETVLAKQNALVLGHEDTSVAFPGMVLYAFAYST
ncbi:MAG: succinylglutamate desuccinylase/aspartoacylase family protein [Patescibacteria group bacterium]|mgnify:CR=1 FL=1